MQAQLSYHQYTMRELEWKYLEARRTFSRGKEDNFMVSYMANTIYNIALAAM